ncbi:MAG: flagellar hook-basal body complex protein FliE [Balneola sp.]|nr:flagellar hook-basal body complex protein FliE [Balneola sp.]|tara:strand:- start:65 stop:370 length:306 start_codon:yes stop_codon:yes gene_type:complete
MIINNIPTIESTLAGDVSKVKHEENSTYGEAFGDMLSNTLETLNDSLNSANEGTESFLSGETENVHEVMLKMQEAHIQFQLVTEVRNKMVEVYQEISRMQI